MNGVDSADEWALERTEILRAELVRDRTEIDDASVMVAFLVASPRAKSIAGEATCRGQSPAAASSKRGSTTLLWVDAGIPARSLDSR